MTANAAGAVWLTGADGFVGGWLRRELAERGRQAAALVLEPARLGGVLPAIRLDLAEAARAAPGQAVIDLEALPPPSGLIHLAALSHPSECAADPPRARAVNTVGPARLYEQILDRWPDLPILHVSSGQVYLPASAPRREDEPVEPVNVYGASKLQGEAVALGLRDRGHRITVVRPFNHTGPGQDPRFALPSFALRIAALERRGGGELKVGRLDAVRDFLHVRQVAAVYLELLARAGEVDVVNVCSGRGRAIGDLLDGLVTRSQAAIQVVPDPARLRGAADPGVLVGDPGRLRSLLGWVPELDEDALLDELLADARVRVEAGEDLTRA